MPVGWGWAGALVSEDVPPRSLDRAFGSAGVQYTMRPQVASTIAQMPTMQKSYVRSCEREYRIDTGTRNAAAKQALLRPFQLVYEIGGSEPERGRTLT
jgi:hypothetical protein